jgi:predicted restriction endonuclease
MAKGKAWTRSELILAINLYCKIPFGKIDMRTPEVIQLAQRLDRTPGSISYKLANFASIDSTLPRKGASNVSRLDIEVWQEFFDNWDDLAFESEKKAAEIQNIPLDKFAGIDTGNLPIGETKERTVKTRVNQQFFRKMILSTYDYRCCITGLPIEDLLIASHIIPWSKDKKNRLNPSNGLCLNALHDRAFDKGLISFSDQYEMLISERIKKSEPEKVDFFLRYNKQKIDLPKRFLPNKDFLAYHRNNIFKAEI